MQTSTRNREPEPSFSARKGHLPQLSISDDNHHVTEAIGYMYGEDENDRRRVSAASSAYRSSYTSEGSSVDGEDLINPRRASIQRKPIPERMSNGISHEETMNPRSRMGRTFSWDSNNRNSQMPLIESRQRSPSVTATSQFPLNDIDYESSPAAVAQELSNLQALRRMSMDVHAAGDPDLPAINPAAMPSAPSHASSPDDSSRLFWVPARLHPELAPKEFKSFLDSKAEQIKRRSGELSSFQSPTTSRSSSLSTTSSASNLNRRKSMLSRQINNPVGYQDGADRLERKRSLSGKSEPQDPNLAELEVLVNENLQDQRPESPEETGDIILPSVPGSSLKRSTRTKYRRGGSVNRQGDRSFAERAAKRNGARSADSPPPMPSLPDDIPPLPSFSSSTEFKNLAETLKDPSAQKPIASTNFSRPAARYSSPTTDYTSNDYPAPTFDSILGQTDATRNSTQSMPELTGQRGYYPYGQEPIPQIVETPPVDESDERTSTAEFPSASENPHPQPPVRHPERTSSRESPVKPVPVGRPPMPRPQTSSTSTSQSFTNKPPRGDAPPMSQPHQGLDRPSLLPGNDTNTSNLSFIPTLTMDKQTQEKKESKKSGWGWLLGKDEAEKKEDKANRKLSKSPQSHDNTRLDVLQTSIDGSSKRRETIELDRDSLRLEEERKKESQRKATGIEKKEKEGLFSSIFGGKKSKADKESKKVQRGLSPEPPHRELKPDIDYSWTRFTILEERAIYRMAHIKLANPRRPLYSQVLLSNFMYSYLAKVQQMHPQMNLPTSAKQQKKQKEQSQHQPEEFTQYQRYQQQQTAQQQHQQQAPSQTAQPQPYSPQQGYEGDANGIHGHDSNKSRPGTGGTSADDSEQYTGNYGGNAYYHQQHLRQDNDDNEDLW